MQTPVLKDRYDLSFVDRCRKAIRDQVVTFLGRFGLSEVEALLVEINQRWPEHTPTDVHLVRRDVRAVRAGEDVRLDIWVARVDSGFRSWHGSGLTPAAALRDVLVAGALPRKL